MDGQQPFRLAPVLPVQAMMTYAIVNPRKTHTRRATCREVVCLASTNGWVSRFDVSTDLGARQANYVRLMSGRRFTTEQAGTIVSFTFPAGQPCFADHRVSLEREPLYVKRGGDWRAQTSQPEIMRSADWLDDFATHQDDLADRRKAG